MRQSCRGIGALTSQYGVPLPCRTHVQHGITRAQCDEYSLRSQRAWQAAQAAGAFKAEVSPVPVPAKKGHDAVMAVDEHPRPETTIESLGKLPAVFAKGGVVTAGSASGIGDGAAAMVIATEAAVREHKLTPLARVVGWSVAGVDPTVMGIGPVPAIQQLLKRTGLPLESVDAWEVNEVRTVRGPAAACESDTRYRCAPYTRNAVIHPRVLAGIRCAVPCR